MRYLFLMLVVAFSVVSCGELQEENTEQSKNQSIEKINSLNKKFNDIFINDYDREKLTLISDTIVTELEQLEKSAPKSEELAELYFTAGEVSMKVFKGKQAIDFFERLVAKFPEHEQTGKAMYFIGYTYENVLDDVEKAKEEYKKLYREMPDSDWGENARSQVLHLNSSPALEEPTEADVEEVKE